MIWHSVSTRSQSASTLAGSISKRTTGAIVVPAGFEPGQLGAQIGSTALIAPLTGFVQQQGVARMRLPDPLAQVVVQGGS